MDRWEVLRREGSIYVHIYTCMITRVYICKDTNDTYTPMIDVPIIEVMSLAAVSIWWGVEVDLVGAVGGADVPDGTSSRGV